ncbi:TRAP transporter permease [Chloroflexota bacterium]
MGIGLSLVALFHWSPGGFVMFHYTHIYYLLLSFLPLCFLWLPLNSKAPRDRIPLYDIALMVLATVPFVYFILNEWTIRWIGWGVTAPLLAIIGSIIVCGLLIESARRAAGLVFSAIVAFFALYPLFAQYLTGFLQAPNFSFNRVFSFHLFSQQSVAGLIMSVFGEYIVGFMVFSTVLTVLGSGKLFNDLALYVVGKARGGNAKVAIIASALFGSISGAVVPNVMTTGAFTIPAMKKDGLPAHFAGAVEAVASSGGVFMPPVMGSAAFIMAEFIAVPYATICIAAAVPAILYFVCLFVQIDTYAARMGLKARPLDVKPPSIWKVLFNNKHIFLSFVVLFYYLFFVRIASQAPYFASAACLIVAMFQKETRLNFKGFLSLIEKAGQTLGQLIGMVAPIGLIIGSLVMTGAAFSLPYQIVSLAQENVFLVILFGAVAAFILGMGATITAVYIFLAIALAPGLVQAGFDIYAVHLFVLYGAMLSSITPPVAIAAIAASSIAGSPPIKTGFQAMKLGGAIYILPLVFIFSPALILRAPPFEILQVISTTTMALVVLGCAISGYMWRLGNLTMISRVLFVATSALMLIPEASTDIYGSAGLIFLYIFVYLIRGNDDRLARLFLQPRLRGDASEQEASNLTMP